MSIGSKWSLILSTTFCLLSSIETALSCGDDDDEDSIREHSCAVVRIPQPASPESSTHAVPHSATPPIVYGAVSAPPVVSDPMGSTVTSSPVVPAGDLGSPFKPPSPRMQRHDATRTPAATPAAPPLPGLTSPSEGSAAAGSFAEHERAHLDALRARSNGAVAAKQRGDHALTQNDIDRSVAKARTIDALLKSD